MTEHEFNLSRRKTLAALGTIGAASAGAGLGTSAFFSDQETFENNRLVAGTLDVKAAYSAHYSDWSDDEDGSTTDTGDDDVAVRMYDGPPGTTGDAEDLESGETGLPTNDAWLVAVDDPEQFLANTETMSDGDVSCPDGTDAEDLDQPVVDLEDVKPGDFGEVTIDFALCDNPGFVWLNGELVSAAENGTTEPEIDDPQEDGNANSTDPADVELLDVVRAAVWVDDGGDGPGGNEDGNNYQNGGEDPVVVGSLRDVLDQFPDKGRPTGAMNAGNAGLVGDIPAEQGGGMGRNCFSAETIHSVAVAWWVPVDHGNQIQTDSATFSLGLYTEQCRHNTGERTEDGFPEDVVNMLLDKEEIAIEPGTEVTFGPASPGLQFVEQNAVGESTMLVVPDSPGDYYAFIIDDRPEHKFAHPVRYAWLEPNREECDTASAVWLPHLFLNGDRVVLDGSESRIISGVHWQFKSELVPISMIDFPPMLDKGSALDNLPGLIVRSTDNILAESNDNVTTDRWQTCFAVVIDGGGDRTQGDAQAIARDANLIQPWLTSAGFITLRISQYRGNHFPNFSVADPDNAEDQLIDLLDQYKAALKACCQRAQEEEIQDFGICFFIYVSAHGFEPIFQLGKVEPLFHGGFKIYSSSGASADNVSYDTLFSKLSEFPDCVRFTIFIDACYSGHAISHFMPSGNGYKQESIITACRGAETTPLATPNKNSASSATEKFDKGSNSDWHDPNSVKGQFSDRLKHMCVLAAGSGHHPQVRPQNSKAQLALPECSIIKFPSDGDDNEQEEEADTAPSQ